MRLACPCIRGTLNPQALVLDRVPAQQSKARAQNGRPDAKRSEPKDDVYAPPAKRTRQEPAAPAPPVFVLPDSDITSSDEDDNEDYEPRAKRARLSAPAPAPAAATPGALGARLIVGIVALALCLAAVGAGAAGSCRARLACGACRSARDAHRPGHALHRPALAALGRLPVAPCMRVAARHSRRCASRAVAGWALEAPQEPLMLWAHRAARTTGSRRPRRAHEVGSLQDSVACFGAAACACACACKCVLWQCRSACRAWKGECRRTCHVWRSPDCTPQGTTCLQPCVAWQACSPASWQL